ncbi:hypothetical protein VTN00DRAFT_5875 [Thermoascus crustaceus]|uniref:uncharacterized protein n=1 Tax=Thermoascus crustaceus TaxID=5088 RepID=UPI0037447048
MFFSVTALLAILGASAMVAATPAAGLNARQATCDPGVPSWCCEHIIPAEPPIGNTYPTQSTILGTASMEAFEREKRIWYQRPPDGTILPPKYPDRPDPFDEVEWDPFVTSDEASLAYRLWYLPDSILSQAPNMRNVYEHMMRDHRHPKTEDDRDENAQMRLSEDGRTWKGWSYEEIFEIEDDGGRQHSGEDGQPEDSRDEIILIDGEDVLRSKYWTVFHLREKRLYDDERRQRREDQQQQAAEEDKGSLLPRTDLSHWGIPRKNDYTLRIARRGHFTPLDMYTWAISLSLYNPTYWVSRAYLFYQTGYLDLAIGDAYRAQLLCEVLVNRHDRNRQPGIYTRIWHAIEQHLLRIPPVNRKHFRGYASPMDLKELQCWADCDNMEEYLTQRLRMPYRDMWAFQKRKQATEEFVHWERSDARDVDRTSEPFLEKLNRELVRDSQLPWKRCEVRPKDGTDELAVYATVDIQPGQIIYADEPSARVISIPPDRRNVKANLDDEVNNSDRDEVKVVRNGDHPEACACALDTDEPIFFCPREPNSLGERMCLQIARELFHFRACGRDWKWLHDAMRPNWNKHPAGTERGPTHLIHSNESHGTLLSLLLREVFDITLLRRERSGNPYLLAHEIDELLPLPGEDQWAEDRFPFTLAGNIKVPFDILLLLGVDIFRDLTFDMWVIQTILRKLLLSVVPWDMHRRAGSDRIDSSHGKIIEEVEAQIQKMNRDANCLQ